MSEESKDTIELKAGEVEKVDGGQIRPDYHSPFESPYGKLYCPVCDYCFGDSPGDVLHRLYYCPTCNKEVRPFVKGGL